MRKLLLAALFAAASAVAAPVVTVIATVGPSLDSDPSILADWRSNVYDTLFTGSATGSGYSAVAPLPSEINGGEAIATPTFESYSGAVTPGSGTFGSAVYFVFEVYDDAGTPFSLADVSYSFDFMGVVNGTGALSSLPNFGSLVIGYDEFGNPVANSTDPVVDAFGVLAAFSYTKPGSTPDQAGIDAGIADLQASYDRALEACVTAGSSTSCAQTSFTASAAAVPEPMTMALMGVGLAGLAILRRRK